MSSTKTILIIGGTGAQGLPIIHQLTSQSPAYKVRVLTRDTTHARSVELAKNPNVELVQGSSSSEVDLDRAFEGVYGAFVNLNGFAMSEKEEVWLGIRCWEIARRHRVKHYVWSNLPYSVELADWRYRTGHLDAKGRVAKFISTFHSTPDATWSFLTTGPYVDTLWNVFHPSQAADGTFVFGIPLEDDGHMPLIALDDIGFYTRWIFDHPEESSGLNLEATTAMASGRDIAEAFTKATGKPARYNAITVQQFFDNTETSKMWDVEKSFGMDNAHALTIRQNFTGFFRTWQENSVKRDLSLQDKIHPHRYTLESWMKAKGYDGVKSEDTMKQFADAKTGA